MNKQTFIKENLSEIIILISVPLTFYYLIPFPYCFIAIFLSLIASGIILFYIYKETKKNCCIFSSLGFLVSIYSKLNQQCAVKEAYENSTKYLSSYYSIKTYEEICEDSNSYNLENNEYFSYIIEKDKQNEAMLINYSSLYELALQKYDKKETEHKKNRKKHIINLASFALCFVAMAIVFNIYPTIKEAINSMYYFIVGLITTSLLFPILELNMYFKLKEENKNEE